MAKKNPSSRYWYEDFISQHGRGGGKRGRRRAEEGENKGEEGRKEGGKTGERRGEPKAKQGGKMGGKGGGEGGGKEAGTPGGIIKGGGGWAYVISPRRDVPFVSSKIFSNHCRRKKRRMRSRRRRNIWHRAHRHLPHGNLGNFLMLSNGDHDGLAKER